MDPAISIEGKVHDLPLVSCGVSSMVYAVSETAVIKAHCGSEGSRQQLAVERAIYERSGPHTHITRLLSVYKDMFVLGRLRYPLRKRLVDLCESRRLPATQDVVRWAAQIMRALDHAHAHGVFQVDIGAHNVLLDSRDNAKLSDFAGSSMDGPSPSVLPSISSEHPRLPAAQPTLQSELFALGCMLYEIETTRKPYHDKDDAEVEQLYAAGEFPDVSSLVLGAVIMKCWRTEYANVTDGLHDVEQIRQKLGARKSWSTME